MDTLDRRVLLGAAGLLGVAAVASIARGGPLDPPAGPIAPTGKSLDQVRPGTPIDTIPFIITQPGSYYLTANFTHNGPGSALVIEAPDVTIDLAGFTLTGPGSGINGVEGRTTATNLRVRNGTVTRFAFGVVARGGNAQIIDIRAVRNGSGIVASASLISQCVAVENTGVGVTTSFAQYAIPGGASVVTGTAALVERCSAIANGEGGFDLSEGTQIIDSVASINKRFGINTASGSTSGGNRIERCTVIGTVADAAVSLPGYGIALGTGSSVTDTTVRGCASGGIFLASSRNSVRGCIVSANGGFGIGSPGTAVSLTNGFLSEISNCHVSGHTGSPGFGIAVVADCSITNNTVYNNAEAGIVLSGGGNRAIGNQCRGNGRAGGSINLTAQMLVFGDRNHIEGNACNSGPQNGITILASRNVVIRNVCGGNPNANYSIGSSNIAGPIIDRVANGGAITTSDPTANISY